MKFKFLEHTADIKFKAFGKTLNEVFQNSTLAVSSYLSRGKKIKSRIKKSITINADDIISLYYKFLDELIYLLDAESFIVSNALVKITDNKLTAQFYGDDSKKYKDTDHIKAATYSEMYIIKLPNNIYEAQAVLDV